MKFVADAMLGRLAKWMRVIGCDVAYFRRIDDGELVDLAMREGRMILTKDTLLIKRRKARGSFLLIEGNSHKDQLRQVVERFSINPYEALLTRCAECNIPLSEIDREKVRGSIPEYVFETHRSFRVCPACGRIYWPATHKDAITKTLNDIFGNREL